jgi:protoporphyrinogen oxidase
MKKKVCVVGGGISGLSAGYFLLKKGYHVKIYERSNRLGGFATSFDFGGFNIEKYYHFICGGDQNLLGLASQLGIGHKIKFRPTKTASFYNGQFFSFSTPMDLLKFSPISFFSRLKFGLMSSRLKMQKTDKERLDRIPAKEWLIGSIGGDAYQVIWHPLLKKKFGDYYDQISASYIWQRMQRVATSRKNLFAKEKMGYFEGGTHLLIETIRQRILELEGDIHLEAEVESVEKENNGFTVFYNSEKCHVFDRVVLAVPLPCAAQIIKRMSPILSDKWGSIRYFGIVCGIFRLSHRISDAFWLNINDPRIVTNGLIEYTNLNPLPEIEPHKIVYMPLYLPVEDQRYSDSEKDILRKYERIAKVLKPGFSASDIVDVRVNRSRYAQAIPLTGFKDDIPPVKTPIEHLFLLDSTQVYPSDRSLDAMIGLSKKMTDRDF